MRKAKDKNIILRQVNNFGLHVFWAENSPHVQQLILKSMLLDNKKSLERDFPLYGVPCLMLMGFEI